MKKRSFYAILVVAIGLFISLNLGSFAASSASSSSAETGGGGNTTSLVNGTYVPD